MIMTSLVWATTPELATAIHVRHVPAVEVLQAYLHQIHRHNRALPSSRWIASRLRRD